VFQPAVNGVFGQDRPRPLRASYHDSLTTMASRVLKRASVSRPSGQWNDDDYDVAENGVVVGRTSASMQSGRRAASGCGRAATVPTMSSAPRTAMRRAGRLRWRRSLGTGAGVKSGNSPPDRGNLCRGFFSGSHLPAVCSHLEPVFLSNEFAALSARFWLSSACFRNSSAFDAMGKPHERSMEQDDANPNSHHHHRDRQ
jgi:hypothetical protein